MWGGGVGKRQYPVWVISSLHCCHLRPPPRWGRTGHWRIRSWTWCWRPLMTVLHHCSALYVRVFAQVPLHFIMTTPWEAPWGLFSSHVLLMKSQSWGNINDTVGSPCLSEAKHPGPLGSDPGVFPLNQLLPGAGCLGEGLLHILPWISLMSCLHLEKKGSGLGWFWIIYDEDIGLFEFGVGLLSFLCLSFSKGGLMCFPFWGL